MTNVIIAGSNDGFPSDSPKLCWFMRSLPGEEAS